jgi:hypothetical protein
MRSGTVILQVWTTLQGLHILLTTYAELSHVMHDIVDNMETCGKYEVTTLCILRVLLSILMFPGPCIFIYSNK